MPRHCKCCKCNKRLTGMMWWVFYTVWLNWLWFCKLYRQNQLFFTLHGRTDQFLAHYVLELTVWFLHTACLWFCKEHHMDELAGSAHFGWTELVVVHAVWVDSIINRTGVHGWIPGCQHQQSRRAREHVVWVDSKITRAGEQDSTLYEWIPTSPEQESKTARCMSGFQHHQSRRTREHAVRVDSNIDRAGEQENRPASWQLLGRWCFNKDV